MRSWLSWLGVLGISTVLAGCEDDLRKEFEQPYRPPAPRLIKKSTPIVKKNTIKFAYSPVKKRDPFRSHLLTTKSLGVRTATGTTPVVPLLPKAPKTELEKYELDSLKVVATITGVANPMAMIEAPDGVGQGFIARRGTLIGKNSGRITRIYPDGIVVSEVYRDVTGKRIVNRVTLRIKRKESNVAGALEIGGRKITLGEDGQIVSSDPNNSGTSNEVRTRTKRLFRQKGVGVGD